MTAGTMTAFCFQASVPGPVASTKRAMALRGTEAPEGVCIRTAAISAKLFFWLGGRLTRISISLSASLYLVATVPSTKERKVEATCPVDIPSRLACSRSITTCISGFPPLKDRSASTVPGVFFTISKTWLESRSKTSMSGPLMNSSIGYSFPCPSNIPIMEIVVFTPG